MRFSLSSFVWGVFATLLILAVAGLIVVWTGAFQVAASVPHSAFGRWIFDTTFENSVARQAKGDDPPAFTPAMISDGAGEFKETCQDCHGGVGVKPDGWTKGMLPNPPDLSKAAKSLTPAEVFWIVKHGVKMTGMPSFGVKANDHKLWDIAAFVKSLPTMSAAQYAGYKAEKDGSEAGGSS